MHASFGYQELADLMKAKAGVTIDPAVLERSPDASWATYELDSLGLLGVIVALEEAYGFSLDTAAQAARTPRELVDIVTAELHLPRGA